MLKKMMAILLCLLIPTVALAGTDTSYKVIYDGGSVPTIKASTTVRLYIEEKQVRLTTDDKDRKEFIVIPAASITELSYGQEVHRRVGTAIGLAVLSLGIGALMMFSKSKKHYVGMTWADGDKKGGFAMQCDKNEYRGILAALEGVSGKKAVDTDAVKDK